MKCSDKEWQHCNKEKMGCEGCFYNDEISIGDYVRTKLGDIKKITKGFEFIIERHNKSYNKIVKHSKEIIEEFIEQYNASYPEEKECVAIYPEQIEAIENLLLELKGTKIDLKLQETENENLIQENKELKEKVKGLECEIEIKKYCKVDEVINDLTYYKNLAKEYQGSCIPKSKLKEKFENMRKKHNNLFDIQMLYKEVLEEEWEYGSNNN